MQFQLPQFIEVEDKIFGPFTLKQFLYMAGGAGGAFIVWRFSPDFLGIFKFVIALPVLIIGLALAFYTINGKPLIVVMEAAFNYMVNSKLYLWQKRELPPQQATPEKSVEAKDEIIIPKLSQSRLQELTWSLDVHEKVGSTTAEKLHLRE